MIIVPDASIKFDTSGSVIISTVGTFMLMNSEVN